ncbi:hypothetical protein DRQ16_03880, partial [bacterium]
GDGSRWYWRVGQGGIPVVRGETYWLCGWIRTDFTQGKAKLVIGDYLGNSAHFDNLTGRTSWRYAYASFVPQNDSVRISAMIIDSAQGRAWFDHFSLIKDTLPPRVLVLSPEEGERFMVNDNLHLSWHTHDDGTIDHFEVYYSFDGINWTGMAVVEKDKRDTVLSLPSVPSIPQEVYIRIDEVRPYGNILSDTVKIVETYLFSTLDYNNQRKIIAPDTVHWVYTYGNKVYHAFYDGEYHAGVIDYGSKPSVVASHSFLYVKDRKVIYYDGGDRFTLHEGPPLSQVSGPSGALYKGRLHFVFDVAWEGVDRSGYDVIYGVFNPSTGSLEFDTLGSYRWGPPTSSCLSLDSLGGVHVVWTRPSSGYIFYAWKPDGGDWSFDTVSTSGSHPFVDFHGDFVHVVWERDGTIYHRKRWIYGDWEREEAVWSGSSPQIAGGYLVNASPFVYWTYPDGWMNRTSYDYSSSRICGDSLFRVLYPEGDELRLLSFVISPPWFMSDDTLATFGNNQRKVCEKNGRLDVVFTGYDKVFYRYFNGYWSESMVLGDGILPSVSRGRYTSVVYLTSDSFPVYVKIDEEGIRDTLFDFKVTSPPACEMVKDTVYLGFTDKDSVFFWKFISLSQVEKYGIRGLWYGCPSLSKDASGKVHAVYHRVRGRGIVRLTTVYHGVLGGSFEEVGEGLNPSVCASGIVDISWQTTSSFIMRRTFSLTGEDYGEERVGSGEYPVALIYGNAVDTVLRVWDGNAWRESFIPLRYPSGFFVSGLVDYELILLGWQDGRVRIYRLKENLPSHLPFLSTDVPYGTGYNNAGRLAMLRDTLYLAYTSSGKVFLSYSTDLGRHWSYP